MSWEQQLLNRNTDNNSGIFCNVLSQTINCAMIFNIIKSYVYTVKYNKQRGVPGASSGCGRRLRLLLKKTLTIQSVTVI